MVTVLESSAALPIFYLLILFSVEYRFSAEQINYVQACQASVKRDRKNKTKFPGGENTPDFTCVCVYVCIFIYICLYIVCVWCLDLEQSETSVLTPCV